MIIKTRGIVLKFTRYRETSIITNIFTEEVGLSSFIVNNVRSAKGKFKPSYFELLSLVELNAYHHPDREINRLSEIKSITPLHSLRQNIFKSSIVVFLAEMLNKVIIEKDKNEALFNFLFRSLITFEKMSENNNFHLQFLFQLTTFLGFSVENPSDFVDASNNQVFYREPQNLALLKTLVGSSFEEKIKLDSATRAIILNDIIFYYQQHMGITKLKSLDVLNAIFK